MFVNGRFLGRENGAQAHCVDTLQFIDRNFDDVTLYTISNHPTDPWRAQDVAEFRTAFPNVTLCMDRSNVLLRGLTRLKNALIATFPSWAPQVLRWRIPRATPVYDKLRARHEDHVCLVHFVDSLTVLNGFPFTTSNS